MLLDRSYQRLCKEWRGQGNHSDAAGQGFAPPLIEIVMQLII